MRYDETYDESTSDDRRFSEEETGTNRREAYFEEDDEPRRLSRRELRRKRRLEERLQRLARKEGPAMYDAPEGGQADEDGETASQKRRSHFVEALMSFLSGNILSTNEVRKTYPYLLFVAFLAFLYIGNIFSMQRLHRQRSILTREVRELRTKSMTMASQLMQETRQSNIIDEIQKRGLPLRESLQPNKVIPK